MRTANLFRAGLLALLASALVACRTPAPAGLQLSPTAARPGQGASLVVQPGLAAPSRKLLAAVPALTTAAIDHLAFSLARVAGGTETPVASLTVGDPAKFLSPLTFANLRLNSLYRVRASAYGDAAGTTLLSDPDQSFVDIAVGPAPTPQAPVGLTITLKDVPFDGQGTLPASEIVGGGYAPTLRGVVSLFAGTPPAPVMDGTGTAARFTTPSGVAIDSAGNLYVADASRIRKVTPAGVVSTLAGSGTAGYADGNGTSAQFNTPRDLAVDASGTLYVADSNNHRIRKITPGGVVTTFAGSGTAGYADATGVSAQFNNPQGLAVDASGNLYVADASNHRIRQVTPDGVVTTLAGSGTQGFADATGASALFNTPQGLAVDASGNLYVADSNNHRLRKITPDGVVTTFAGSGTAGYADGTGTSAKLNYPVGIAIDTAGNLCVADVNNYRVRKVTSTGVVTTLAGSGTAGLADGTGANALFNPARGIAIDTAGNLYVADPNNSCIRQVTPAGVVTTFAGKKSAAYSDGAGTSAQFYAPNGIAIDTAGNLYVADYSNHRLRKITPDGVVTTLAGDGIAGFADGTGTSARFNTPRDLAVDTTGNLYVSDGTNRIRKVTPDGVVTTLAGSGTASFADATGVSAQFNNPQGLAIDASGNLYVADASNHRIRKVTPDGVVTTLAGSGASGNADGPGTTAKFNNPRGIAIDTSGNLYVADSNNSCIRKVTPDGVVTTLAGNGTSGFADGTGTGAQFRLLFGMAIDASDNLYVADTGNQRIRKVTPDGVVTTLAGSGTAGFADGIGASAQFSAPRDVAIDAAGNLYVADANNNCIRIIR